MPAYDLPTIVSRLESQNAAPSTDDARAAVAAIFRAPKDHSEPQILMIRRAEREGDPWSGHMAFPGGKREPNDPSLLVTALRETHEEVGLDLERHGRFVARMPNVPAMTRAKGATLQVGFFVFVLDEPEHPEFVLSSEVVETYWVPIGPMVRGEVATTFPYRYEGALLQLPAFSVQERIVWGLTHRMLSMVFAAL
ncbi:MAG TPA: CoA pyrophosphatase [Polyangium sp.]|nr:CoA pyrophosphatase [Polyangium sp.]